MTTWASGRSLEHSKWTPGFRKSGNVTTTKTTRSARTWTFYFFLYTLRILRNILAFIRRFVPKALKTPRPLYLYLLLRHCWKLYYMSQHIRCVLDYYKGADKSLARPGRKQAKVSVRMAWISFGALPCRKQKNMMTACVLMLLKSRASLTCFRACFLPGRAKDLLAPRYIALFQNYIKF